MDKFSLTIETENAAFDSEASARAELCRILSNVVVAINRGDSEGKLRDINGNTVGSWVWEA